MPPEGIHYRRSRFSTRLPEGHRYTSGHMWVSRLEAGHWRVGFTKFAVRMLGEIVELGFEVKPAAEINSGQMIGWIEGFKAVSDIYTPIDGRFEGGNPDLDSEIMLVRKDPYGRGWLFSVRGEPGGDCLDVQGYISVLDATIDKMLGKRHEQS